MIISTDAETAFDKIQNLLMIKTLSNLGTEFPQFDKGYLQPTVNITLKSKRLNIFLPR